MRHAASRGTPDSTGRAAAAGNRIELAVSLPQEAMVTDYPNVGTWIERRARVAGDHTAVIFGDTRRTYADLATRIRRLANGLRALGVQRRDRVAWVGANHPAFLEALFASATIGAALAPISHRLDPDAIGDLLAAVDPRVVLLNGMKPPVLPATTAFAVDDGSLDNSPYERLIAGHADTSIDEQVAPDDLCLMPFTSGTTGRPKAIMLTQANLTWNLVNVLSSLGVRSDDVTIAVAPFFRTGGTGVNVLPVLFQGGAVVIPETTAPHVVFRLIAQHRVTIGFGNPDLLQSLARSPRWRTADLTSLRLFITGGAPVPQRLLRAYHEREINLVQGYGLSEAAPLVSVVDAANARRKPGSAGRPVIFVDTRIAGPDGPDRFAGQIGELLVRGPNVMAGYWNQPDATRRVLDEHGWLRTGDAASADADGDLFIVGRMEDAYITGGELVHPGLAERVLLQHPSVAEVSVVGENQRAVAYVVRVPGAQAEVASELLTLCREQLQVHACPDEIQFLSALPKNANGKILRGELRRRQAATERLTPRMVFH